MVQIQRHDYHKAHCYQYDIRLKNLKTDLIQARLTRTDTQKLKVSDFKFSYVDKSDQITCKRIKHFIEKHEWLGKMPHRPTHRFIATYKGQIAGVIVMATPNTFSHLLGKENRDKEKLISRGACISWSPKNLGSALLMFSIRWMVKHTNFRFFTGYSDTEAKELGTIYQACNFTYLGKNSGGRAEYFDPFNPEKEWFSDRQFRRVSQYKKYAKDLKTTWLLEYGSRNGMNWHNVPDDIELRLRQASRNHQRRCLKRKLPKKHKYVYILGRTKSETKRLKNRFKKNNPKTINLAYPKVRGE
ncbi:MAG: hypothetical protein CME65_00035 [Halobacteriovoraceae bacterium]|nr:hypothetical protein [Halobacteriovoraceae bacterium]